MATIQIQVTVTVTAWTFIINGIMFLSFCKSSYIKDGHKETLLALSIGIISLDLSNLIFQESYFE